MRKVGNHPEAPFDILVLWLNRLLSARVLEAFHLWHLPIAVREQSAGSGSCSHVKVTSDSLLRTSYAPISE